jgi:hypothetical protein
LRAFVFITPREEEGVFKVVFQSACVQTLRARKRKGDCTAEEARDQKKERKCLGFICYPKYWRNANTKIFFREERGSERRRASLCASLVVFFFVRKRGRGKPPSAETTK